MLIWIGLGDLDLTLLCKFGLYWKIYNRIYIMLRLGDNCNCLEGS